MNRKKLEKTLVLAMSKTLYAPDSFLEAKPYELGLVCNGCGAANAKFDFVPDKIYGTYIGHACHIHDWMYDQGVVIEDKKKADRVFLNNLLRLIKLDKAWYKPTFLMRIRAKMYYKAVKYYGGSAFWEGKN